MTNYYKKNQRIGNVVEMIVFTFNFTFFEFFRGLSDIYQHV
jgi:hypothetical protein